MRFLSFLLLGLLLARPAMAQSDEEIVAEILGAIQPRYASNGGFLIGPGIHFGGETRSRASDAPGVCERDEYNFGLTRRGDPEIPPALEIRAEREYFLRFIEDEPDDPFTREYLFAQDEACSVYNNTNAHFFPVREPGLSDPFTLVWLAGQAMTALRQDHVGSQAIDWSCRRDEFCPPRESALALLDPGNLIGVAVRPRACRVEEDCFSIELDEPGLERGHWIATVGVAADDRWFPLVVRSVIWSWDDETEIDD